MGGGAMGGMGMGMGGSGMGQQPDWGSLGQPGGMGAPPDVDYGELENLGKPKPKPQDDLDWGILGGEGGASGGLSGDPFEMGRRDEELGGGAADEEEDDEFTVFAGFDKDNKPTNKKSSVRRRRALERIRRASPCTPPHTPPYTPPHTPPYTPPHTSPHTSPHTPPHTSPRSMPHATPRAPHADR